MLAEKIHILHQPTSITLLLNPGRTYTFDPSGRPISLYVNDRYFARALSGSFVEKSWTGAKDQFDRFIRPVPSDEKAELLENLERDIHSAIDSLEMGHVRTEIDGSHPIKNTFNDPIALLSFLQERLDGLDEEENCYREMYKPISILPPDHYFTIVVQVTEGCSWNQCVFCDFYQDRPFKIRSFEEIRAHLRDVSAFLKDGVRLRNSIFLADANAFVMKPSQLMPILAEIRMAFPEQMASVTGGMSSFADVPTILAKSLEDIRLLRDAGLRRLYIGMETGSDELRQHLRKPGTSSDVVRAVTRLKQSGMNVGLILMLGLGGEENASKHVDETLATFKELSLDSSDILFFSPFYPERGSSYDQLAAKNKWTPLDRDAQRQQYHAFKRALFSQTSTPRVGVYDIREFVY